MKHGKFIPNDASLEKVICIGCGKKFVPTNNKQKYCIENCRRKHPLEHCPHCNKDYIKGTTVNIDDEPFSDN